jgi:hypothetical protein
MGERNGRKFGVDCMNKAVVLGVLGILACGATPAAAEPASSPSVAASPELSSQARRPPTRLRVRPGGRLLYRDCTFRLAQQWRPGGPVVVPVQRCWWVRG